MLEKEIQKINKVIDGYWSFIGRQFHDHFSLGSLKNGRVLLALINIHRRRFESE